MRLAAALALVALSCASAPQRTSGPPAEGELSGSFLAGDDLVVLGLHRVSHSFTLPDARAVLAMADSALASRDTPTTRFEAGLRSGAASRGIGARWIWRAAQVAAHRRNPILVPNPNDLSAHELRGRNVVQEGAVPQRLSGELRTLVAATGGRRFVLLPLEATVDGSGSKYRARVHVVLIDSRRQLIGWERWVEGDSRTTLGEALHSAGERTVGLFVPE